MLDSGNREHVDRSVDPGNFRAAIESADPVTKVVLSSFVSISREIGQLNRDFVRLNTTVNEVGQDVASLKALAEINGTLKQRRKRQGIVNGKTWTKKQRGAV